METILTFSDRQSFREWLDRYGAESDGVWLLFSKKGKFDTLTAVEALEEALCSGWIDGQIQSVDEKSYKKYFARRVPRSKWSERNKELAKTLMEKGLMRQQGMKAIEQARKNGLWDNVKSIQVEDEQIEEFKAVIQPHELAYGNLLGMSPSVQRTYTRFYLDAKSAETRQTRLEKIIERLKQNLKPM